jgi:hypothetical protein
VPLLVAALARHIESEWRKRWQKTPPKVPLRSEESGGHIGASNAGGGGTSAVTAESDKRSAARGQTGPLQRLSGRI